MAISIKRTSILFVTGLLPVTIIAGTLAMSAPAPAAAANPRVLPVHSKPHGKTYAQWAAAYWQWALSIPADTNPLTDTTGEFGAEGQSGSVWFLAGTFGDSQERDLIVPHGKTLFVPVQPTIFGSGVFDCEPTVPGVPCDVPTLKATAASNIGLPGEVVEVTIDGAAVHDVSDYRATSATPFAITYPPNSVTGVAAGNYFPQVADGYWLMLAPLSTGQHTIEISVFAPDTPSFGTIDFTLLLHVTVE
jgi:hypothetical protein